MSKTLNIHIYFYLVFLLWNLNVNAQCRVSLKMVLCNFQTEIWAVSVFHCGRELADRKTNSFAIPPQKAHLSQCGTF